MFPGGGGASAYFPPPHLVAGAHELIVIIKHTTFSEIIHHIIISKYTPECTQLNYSSYKNSRKCILSNPLAIKLNSVIRSTTQTSCIIIPSHSLKNYTPIFEHGFLPFINDHLFRYHPPPPLITIGYVTIMPCERSHKRKFPTTPLNMITI